MEEQKWWGQGSGLADLQEKIDTASCGEEQKGDCPGPVKKPLMDYMSHGGEGGDNFRGKISSLKKVATFPPEEIRVLWQCSVCVRRCVPWDVRGSFPPAKSPPPPPPSPCALCWGLQPACGMGCSEPCASPHGLAS